MQLGKQHAAKIILMLAATVAMGCSASRRQGSASGGLVANINLTEVVNDEVVVTVDAPKITSNRVTYQFAKVIPGTYAVADYGRYISNLTATSKSGTPLPVSRVDTNTWAIDQATELKQIRYQVSDTYDNEAGSAFAAHGTTIFSPAGTNILANQNFMLNLCGFVGYFGGLKDIPYTLSITHPAGLTGSTALNDLDKSPTRDLFQVPRFAEVVDNPIMYAPPDIASATIGNMEVILAVYSPRNKAVTAAKLFPDLERMIRAQKKYLGNINDTKKYAVLTYLSGSAADDAKGFGALEHNTSTTAIFQDKMRIQELIHVISHEFFHTLTPLKVHSREIHDFDFNQPKMSAHLWMYEGFTEYFAQHFQVHEGLMQENEFLDQMASKEKNSKQLYNDSMSFTTMSRNVLDPTYKAQYPNVYEKGALMAMCLDILLREASGGKTGILHLMGELSKKYGATRPFNDEDLIPEITSMTNPEVGNFIQQHIVQGVPIDYEKYLARVGVTRTMVPVPSLAVFMVGGRPDIRLDTAAKKVLLHVTDDSNAFYKSLGVKNGDELISVNGEMANASDVVQILMLGVGFEENSEVIMKIRREGKEMELKGPAKLNYSPGPGFRFTDESKRSLKEAWLKG